MELVRGECVKMEVDGRSGVTVVDERVELTRAGLEVRVSSYVMVAVVVVVVAGIKATAVGRLAAELVE